MKFDRIKTLIAGLCLGLCLAAFSAAMIGGLVWTGGGPFGADPLTLGTGEAALLIFLAVVFFLFLRVPHRSRQ